jgi:DNA repair exonuclease SbcCD nuclease subunit
VLTEPDTFNYDGCDVAMVPWINSGNYEQTLEFLKDTKAQIVFGHFEIAGFEMDRGNICHTGMDKSLFDRFDTVLSGHFHHKSSSGNITYLGNQYEITWADYNDPRGFHVFDTETRELTFVQNPNRMFHKITYDDGATDFAHWQAYDYAALKDSYVKVVVLNKQNPYLFDNVIDNLYKAGVGDISIVEDFTEIVVENDQELIDQAEDTMTILSKYIDNLTLNVDNVKLKNLMKELYVEALTTETE